MGDDVRRRVADQLIAQLDQLKLAGNASGRERPISFAPQLVESIAAGRKTQTRRPVRPANDYAAGDRLWVREKWAKTPGGYIIARQTRPLDAHWFSPLFMPNSAARLWLLVENVRVERIQSISRADLTAEGFPGDSSSIDLFQSTWDSFYDRQGLGWDVNPDVVVISFRIIQDRR